MFVRKCFDPVVVKANRASCDTVNEFRKKYDENGNSVYLKVGEHSLSQEINSYEKTCSLEALLQRCSLMPITDKVKMLQQVPRVGADTTVLPKDLTDAFVKMSELKQKYPDVAKRIAAGESFDSIVKSIIPKKEVTSNVNTESGND